MLGLTPGHEWGLLGNEEGNPQNSSESTSTMGKHVHRVPEPSHQQNQQALMQEFPKAAQSLQGPNVYSASLWLPAETVGANAGIPRSCPESLREKGECAWSLTPCHQQDLVGAQYKNSP